MLKTKVEIELTSRCNAACPGCRRTIMQRQNQQFELLNLDANVLYRNFSSFNLSEMSVKLCGVLGDPLVHPHFLSIVRWFTMGGAEVQISTNASLRSVEEWTELGILSRESGRVYVHFAIDGLADTNHLYRVNTSFETIQRNLQAYSKVHGAGAWIFIEFDHNAHQKEEARKIAGELGFEFLVRRAAKNSIFEWTVHDKKDKDLIKYKVVKKESQPHEELEAYKKILNNEIIKYESKSIDCKFKHGNEFFISSAGTVWPCCYLWDEYIAKNSQFHQTMENTQVDKNWNSLQHYSLSEILNAPFFNEINLLWEQNRPIFQKRCYLSCGSKGKLRNSFANV